MPQPQARQPHRTTDGNPGQPQPTPGSRMPWDRPETETKLETERKNLDLWCRAAGVAATLGAFALDLLIKPLAMILLFAGAVGIISAIAGAPWGYLAWRVIDPSPSRTFSIIVIWLAGGMLTAMSLGILTIFCWSPMKERWNNVGLDVARRCQLRRQRKTG